MRHSIFLIPISLLASFAVLAGDCFSETADPELTLQGAEGGSDETYSSSFDKTVKETHVDQSKITDVREALREREFQIQSLNRYSRFDSTTSSCAYSGPCSFNSESTFLDFQFGKKYSAESIRTLFDFRTGIEGALEGRTDEEIILSVRDSGIDWKPNVSGTPLTEEDWQKLDDMYRYYKKPLSNRAKNWNQYVNSPGGIKKTLNIRKLSEFDAVRKLDKTKLNSSSIFRGVAFNEEGQTSGHMVTVTKISENPHRFVINDNLFPAISKNGEEIMSSQEAVEWMKGNINPDVPPNGGTVRNSFVLFSE